MTHYFPGVVFGLLLTTTPLCAQTDAAPASHTLERAEELMKAGQTQKALRAYDELVQVDSLRIGALTMRGQMKFLVMGDAEGGFKDLQEAISLAPANLLALTTRSNMYTSMNMPDRALADARAAMGSAKDGPDSSMVHFVAGLAYLQKRNFQEAHDHFAYCLQQDSLNEGAAINMATTLDNMGRREEALSIMTAMASRHPNDLATMSNIGFILSKMDRYGEAIQWFDKCVNLNPKEAVPLNNRGYAKLRNGDPDGALKDIERSIKLNPENSYAYRNLGLAMQEKGDIDGACTAWESALSRGFTRNYGPEVKTLYDTHCH